MGCLQWDVWQSILHVMSYPASNQMQWWLFSIPKILCLIILDVSNCQIITYDQLLLNKPIVIRRRVTVKSKKKMMTHQFRIHFQSHFLSKPNDAQRFWNASLFILSTYTTVHTYVGCLKITFFPLFPVTRNLWHFLFPWVK